MRILLLLLLFHLASAGPAAAQWHWLIQAGAGTAYGSVNSRIDKGENRYHIDSHPWITPTAGVSAIIPVSRKLNLEPGLLYARKGFRGIDEFTIHNGPQVHEVMFDTRYRLHYLMIPVTLNYTIVQQGQHKLQVGVGMNYAFLLSAVSDYLTRQSTQGDVYENWFRNNKLYTGLMQTKNTYGGTMNIFDAGVKLQLSYLFRSRILLRLFHEQSLYSVYLKDPYSRPAVRLRYTGLSAGILLWSARPDKTTTVSGG